MKLGTWNMKQIKYPVFPLVFQFPFRAVAREMD